MDKTRKINLKKQLHSLKFFYEELFIENKALTSEVNYLEAIFKQTKQYTNQKNIKNKNFDFNFKNDKKYQNIKNKRMNLLKNIDKQNKTLKESILFNKYIELQKEKENLIQTIEEKKNNMKSLQNELNLYKKYNPYNSFSTYKKLKSKIYLNEVLDIPLFSQKKNENNNITLIKPKFKRAINKEKIEQKKLLINAKTELKNLYDYSLFYFKKSIKELGFQSILINKKNNKTYIISIEPNQIKNANSSDTDSDINDEINTNKSNSINERLFIDNFRANKNLYKNNNLRKSLKNINSRSIYKNSAIDNNNNNTITGLKLNNINNFNNANTEININMPSHFPENNNYYTNILTEGNTDKINELNTKLLKIKENYYNCLDKRYQLKSALKENISLIYKTKERIKKIKKQNNLK